MGKNQALSVGIYLCFMLSLIATLGSLFFSEVQEFMPCTLCWYQRIAMYPLVLLFLVGMFQDFKVTMTFTFPLTGIGWLVALYHNLLHYKIVPETMSPCRAGVPCSTIYINWFGFITIPMLSFVAFSLIALILIFTYKQDSNEK